MTKKVILVDFDGTLNSYKSGFDASHPEHLPDPPNPGAIGWLRMMIASSLYKPVIFTTRALILQTGQINLEVASAITDWLVKYGLDRRTAGMVDVTCIKIPCSLIVDDNAFRYEGKFPSPEDLVKLTRRQ